jgi:glycosyltransferase involved in cell wall biosynthesis
MVGVTPGYVTTQGLVLSNLYREAGHPVLTVSSRLNRYARLADIVNTIIRERDQIDILVIEVYGRRSFVVEDVASWIGRRLGKRIVMWLHGGALPEFTSRFPQWTRRVLGRADALVAPSEFMARLVNSLGFRARVIPNVIDIAAYPYRHRARVSPRLFWMRSFHPIYDPVMALRVLAELRLSVPESTLVMAGRDKGIEDEVRQQAANLGLSSSVRFAGFLDMPGKIREGSAADIYLNTNHIDNMPVAVVEACAMGLPVVATAVGGVPDLLTHGETGLFVPKQDDQAMVRAVKSLLRNPDLASRLSANGRSLAERSSWPSVRTQWDSLFDEMMRPRHHAYRAATDLPERI